MVRGDGSIRDMIVNKATLTNVDGSLAGLVGVLIDITDRKEAEQELLFRNLILTTQQEVSPDGILVVDENGMIVSCNRRFQDMWSIPSELIERGVDEPVMHYVAGLTTDPARFLGGAKLLHQDRQEVHRGEMPLVDGRIVEWYSAPMFGADGHYYGRVWYHSDVTDRRNAEKERAALREQLLQSQKMELVGKLAGGVAHDFNNILMVQKGYCELMAADLPADSPSADSLAQIEACTERAAALTRQLLAFSRKQTLQPKILDLNVLAEGLAEMLRRVVGEDLDVVIELAPTPALVEADPGQLEQVLVNLAANARDAMPQGGTLTISISVGDTRAGFCREHPDVAPGRHVKLVVSDTGCGMDADTKGRLFDPFFTTKAKGKGTGLGLSMVQGIVIQSGGDIWVSSEPGEGATFTICLPCAEGEPEEPAPAPPGPARGGGEHILVVEDEPALRELVTLMIEGLGYQTSDADSGESAIAMVETEGLRPDLILTDVIMPGLSGRTLAEALSRIIPGVKVVYMSGYTDDAIAHHGVLDPGVEFIQKPFSMAVLADKIRSVLSSGG